MKNIFKVSIITVSMVMFYSVNSFAIVDGALYGGGGYKGEIEGDVEADPQAKLSGFKVHLNTSLIPLLEVGIGGYYQHTLIEIYVPYSAYENEEKDIKRDSLGVDANVILKLGIPVHPYLRGTYAIQDKLTRNNMVDTAYFKAYGAGWGVEIPKSSFLIFFAELMFENTVHKDAAGKNYYIRMNTINIGLKVNIEYPES